MSPWVTEEEANRKLKARRDAYTWADAKKDLALTTRLTLDEADRLLGWLEGRGIHPYDAVQPVTRLLVSIRVENYDRIGTQIAALLDLARRVEK